jgi:Uma2 family endonuclease
MQSFPIIPPFVQKMGYLALDIPPVLLPKVEIIRQANPYYRTEYQKETERLVIEYKPYQGKAAIESICRENYLALHIPREVGLEQKEQAEAFWVANSKQLMEYFFQTLFIKYMAHDKRSGRFNVRFTTEFENWNQETLSGLVYDSNIGIRIDDGSWRVPDGCFVSFFTASLQEQLSGGAFLEEMPDFLWEIVSDPNDLEKEKLKMKEIWAEQEGFVCGLLIDPFSKNYWLYEKGRKDPSQYGFFSVFSHSSLPKLRIDFGQIYKTAFEMMKKEG